MIHKRFTGDSENDLKINIFLAAVESAVDVDVDADVRFKDPALNTFMEYVLFVLLRVCVRSGMLTSSIFPTFASTSEIVLNDNGTFAGFDNNKNV